MASGALFSSVFPETRATSSLVCQSCVRVAEMVTARLSPSSLVLAIHQYSSHLSRPAKSCLVFQIWIYCLRPPIWAVRVSQPFGQSFRCSVSHSFSWIANGMRVVGKQKGRAFPHSNSRAHSLIHLAANQTKLRHALVVCTHHRSCRHLTYTVGYESYFHLQLYPKDMKIYWDEAFCSKLNYQTGADFKIRLKWK